MRINLDSHNSEYGNGIGIICHSLVFAYFVLKQRFFFFNSETSKYLGALIFYIKNLSPSNNYLAIMFYIKNGDGLLKITVLSYYVCEL